MADKLSNIIGQLPTLIASYVSFFALTYLLMKYCKDPKSIRDLPIKTRLSQKAQYWTNYVSILHALIVLILSVISGLRDGIAFEKDNSNIDNMVAGISYGYFINETMYGFYYDYNDTMTHIHHVLGLLILPYSLIKQRYGNVICWVYIIGEISNPFMLLRNNLLKHSGFKFCEFICGVLFCILFMSMRVFGGAVIGGLIYLSHVTMFVKMIFALLWFLSLVWSFKVLNLFLKHFAEKNSDNFVGTLYKFVDGIRKNNNKMIIFFALAATISFLPPFITFNHEALI